LTDNKWPSSTCPIHWFEILKELCSVPKCNEFTFCMLGYGL
jgi:hypothetical protein